MLLDICISYCISFYLMETNSFIPDICCILFDCVTYEYSVPNIFCSLLQEKERVREEKEKLRKQQKQERIRLKNEKEDLKRREKEEKEKKRLAELE